jgi:sarcosine oxidase
VVGLATTAALLERGQSVICFERSAPMTERSAGRSRIFRLAHREADLVDLAVQARRRYGEWEQASGQELIDPVGAVISGAEAPLWSAAMAAAGVLHHDVGPDSHRLRLPTRVIPAESVIDPAGGVLRVDRIGAFLAARCRSAIRGEQVYALDDEADAVVVRAGGGRGQAGGTQDRFDVVVLCAGAGTAPLAAQVGLYPPIALAHHARFTYRMRSAAEGPFQAWLTTSPDGFGSYQHSNAAGQWAVGLHLEPEQVAWPVGAETATATSRELTTAYVRDTVDDVVPEVIDELYCTMNPELGDGIHYLRRGRVLAVHGENLFKFAPLIGERLAVAALAGSLPA